MQHSQEGGQIIELRFQGIRELWKLQAPDELRFQLGRNSFSPSWNLSEMVVMAVHVSLGGLSVPGGAGDQDKQRASVGTKRASKTSKSKGGGCDKLEMKGTLRYSLGSGTMWETGTQAKVSEQQGDFFRILWVLKR